MEKYLGTASSLFLLPLIFSAYIWGVRGSVITAVVSDLLILSFYFLEREDSGFSVILFPNVLFVLLGAFLGYFFDLKKEQEMKEKRWNALFEADPVGLVIIDSEKRQIMDINKAGLDLIGEKKEDLIGKSCKNGFCPAEGDFCPAGQILNEINSREAFVRDHRGNKIPVLQNIRKTSLNGRDVLIETLSDLRESRRDKEQLAELKGSYSALFDEINIPLFRIGTDGNILLVNKAFRQTLGMEAGEKQINLMEFIEGRIEREYLLSLINVEKAADNIELKILNRQGEAMNVLFTAHVKNMEGSEIVEGSMINITAVRQLEEEQRKIQDLKIRGRHLSSVTSLAAGIAHDINNILAGISGHAQILEYKIDDPVLRKSINRINSGVEKADEILKGLLTSIGSFDIHMENLDLLSFIRTLKEELQKQFPDNPLRIIEMIKSAPVQIDKSIFQNLLQEIVENAVKASKSGDEILLTLSGEKPTRIHYNFLEEPEKTCISLGIFDSGTGIPEDQIDRIFDPYYTSEQFGNGAGLGLSKAYGIIQKLKGAIGLETAVGEGTYFYIYLPFNSEL
ncbi:MAG: PAS domain S-box protein [Spirochaetales bacterium]|nr:PAS domain S-box protein [Spirochaetales bacterium]